jgi:hypothetical protein
MYRTDSLKALKKVADLVEKSLWSSPRWGETRLKSVR